MNRFLERIYEKNRLTYLKNMLYEWVGISAGDVLYHDRICDVSETMARLETLAGKQNDDIPIKTHMGSENHQFSGL